MTRYLTRDCDCPDVVTGTGGKRPDFCEPHRERFYTENQLASAGVGAGIGKQVAGTSGVDSSTPHNSEEVLKAFQEDLHPPKPQRRKGLKRSGGPHASPAQRRKVKDMHCLICGVDRHEAIIDPAHVYPQRFAHCECEDGVVALCRAHHDLYDDQLGSEKLDLLPHLIDNGLRTELVHAVVVHDASILHVLEIITGTPWQPVQSLKPEEAGV